ncbi:hypothetical protein BWQ96_04085 [Gracilariopsis chorda]|uniref:Uncharacterized protein n=1 Tax=Gracilariopsis chorda TaxID=448386 RepID=A0A2V3IVG2_9FLOR|nr:hypothetical protein BWQ96_04085 [Gracilariopsis chorda]|eukprot:PXF46079.1 hypothetical protein BWQ96_04085 [Gracilariopsis chorda]
MPRPSNTGRSRTGSVPGSSGPPGSTGLPQSLPPLPRDALTMPGNDDPVPASRGPRSVNEVPEAQGPADPALAAAQAMSSRSDEFTFRELEAQVRILQSSQVKLIQDITKLRTRFDDADVRDVSNDVRVLRADVNTVMEGRKVSGTLLQEVPERLNRLAARLETVEQTIIHDAVPPGAPVSEGSRKSHRATDRHRRKKVKMEEGLPSSSSSESDVRSHGSSSSSSDAEPNHRSRASRSKYTEATHGAVRTREKGRKHLGLKELKPTNLLYRKLLSYRYYRLEDSSIERTPRGTGRVKD